MDGTREYTLIDHRPEIFWLLSDLRIGGMKYTIQNIRQNIGIYYSIWLYIFRIEKLNIAHKNNSPYDYTRVHKHSLETRRQQYNKPIKYLKWQPVKCLQQNNTLCCQHQNYIAWLTYIYLIKPDNSKLFMTIWWHRSGSTMAQVIAYCLMTLSHYLNKNNTMVSCALDLPYLTSNSTYSKICLEEAIPRFVAITTTGHRSLTIWEMPFTPLPIFTPGSVKCLITKHKAFLPIHCSISAYHNRLLIFSNNTSGDNSEWNLIDISISNNCFCYINIFICCWAGRSTLLLRAKTMQWSLVT